MHLVGENLHQGALLHGTVVVKALKSLTTCVLQITLLYLRFNPFGHQLQSESLGNGDDGQHHRELQCVIFDGHDEGAVNF